MCEDMSGWSSPFLNQAFCIRLFWVGLFCVAFCVRFLLCQLLFGIRTRLQARRHMKKCELALQVAEKLALGFSIEGARLQPRGHLLYFCHSEPSVAALAR